MEAIPSTPTGLTPADLAARLTDAKQSMAQAESDMLRSLAARTPASAPAVADHPLIPTDPRAAQAQQLMQVLADADLTIQELLAVVRSLSGTGPALPHALPAGTPTMLASLIEGWAATFGLPPSSAQPGSAVPTQLPLPGALQPPAGPPTSAQPGQPLPPNLTTSPLTPPAVGVPIPGTPAPAGPVMGAPTPAPIPAPPASQPPTSAPPTQGAATVQPNAAASPALPSVVTLTQGGHVVHLDLAADLPEAVNLLRAHLGPALAPLLPDPEHIPAPAQHQQPGQGPTPSPAAVPTQLTPEQAKLAAQLQDVDLTRLGHATLQVGNRTIELNLAGAALTPQDFAGVSAQINTALQGQGMAIDLWAAYAGIWRQYGGWIALAMPSLLAWRLSLAAAPSRPRRFRRREEEKRRGSGRRRR